MSTSPESLKSVLVTGGGGFLSSHIIRLLVKEPGCKIYSASRDPRSHPDQEPTVMYESVDIANETQVEALFRRTQPQVVIHTTSPHPLAPQAMQERVNFILSVYLSSPARVPGMYGTYDYKGMLPQLLDAVRKGQHKMQIGDNKRVFEVVEVRKVAEAHILAAKAVLRREISPTKVPKVDGEAIFISDGHAIPYWDFFRKCYAAAGAPVKPEKIKVIPLGVMQIMASMVEWFFAIFTLGHKTPEMRRQNMGHFERGCNWSLGKAKERLGYEPLTGAEQDEAIKPMVEWGLGELKKP
ncbi:NAD(P)-binding protein [Lindgomyces ingoldianus]|uniref:NAD(P)-binding protein n=1 Tax=Lindgomyces ingoldianus TaxID=673940 RepID=A0ACB6RJ47_9PLEO|nr:NAD(P)-binding protein [Lindgomyces ingoldianus]KAF2478370.1 NAD(P)-binding protein [Lindgomyces ingoldianus]